MSSENNVDENNCPMDSYSIDNVRRGSNHCFYQNRGNFEIILSSFH